MKEVITKSKFKELLFDGMTLMVGGFLSNGSPETLIDLVLESGVKNLTIICNDGGYVNKGVGKLITARRVKKLIASHIGTNPTVGELMQTKEVEVVLVPQGTLVEQIRAGGAGLGGILTQTGLDTVVEDNKQIIKVRGIDYILEEPLKADMSLIGGAIADQYGNLRYIETMRNFNPVMALAGNKVVAEVKEIVASLDPEIIITPHPIVDYIMVGENNGR
ncbi:MAG: 3-oxoacid CoA-transferase subunit A [Candidatus Izemoplasmatales bacterium]|nr:3-oxoacid CoA-transferase subunit A [Candidatus Izemoplasmatales bacterium]